MGFLDRAFTISRDIAAETFNVRGYVGRSVERKGAELAPSRGIVSLYGGSSSGVESSGDYDRMARAGARQNAAVNACVTAHAMAFPEPPLVVYDAEGNPVDIAAAPIDSDAARLTRLLNRPNPWTSQSDLVARLVTSLVLGGNSYLHKRRDTTGRVVELYEYSDRNMSPQPGIKGKHFAADGGTPWIAHYTYDAGDGRKVEVPTADIIHVRWPLADPEMPCRGLAPLLAVARDVDMANELGRYIWALLKNDAVPLSLVRMPGDLSDEQYERAKGDWRSRFGGAARGSTAFVRGNDVDVKRMGAGLDELAANALYQVPEAHICAVLRVPPIIAGVLVGLEQGREGNYESTRRMWREETHVPLWTLVADAVDTGLTGSLDGETPDFDPALTVRFDLANVRALAADKTSQSKIAATGYAGGYMTQNEARALMGLPALDGGDVFSPTPTPPRTDRNDG